MDNNLKILVVTGWYPGVLQPFNGDFVWDQVRLLRQASYRIDIVYVDINVSYLFKGQFSRRTTINIDTQGNKEYIYAGPFWPKNNLFGLSKWIEKYTQIVLDYFEREGEPDLLHCHTYLGACIGHQLKNKCGIPYIVTEHYTGWLDNSIRKSHKLLGRQSMNAANIVTAVSSALGKKLEIELDKEVKVIGNFIDTSLFKYIPISKPPIPFRIVCIGDLIIRKRISTLLEIFTQLKIFNFDVLLEIVGSGPEERNLKTLAIKLGISDKVTFHGQLYKSQVAYVLQKCHLLVHMSQLETFGLVLAEALCSGIPVLSAANQGVNQMKHLYGLQVVESMNLDDYAQAITNLIKDYQSLDLNRISQEATTEFGVMAASRQLRPLYESL